MSAKINIQEPVLDGGIRSVNYFTGRLLTANDLSREKLAHREVDWRLGRALGEGIAYGLEVSIVERGARPTNPAEAQKTPVLRIEPGLAVNRSGQTLALRDPIDLQLVKPTTPVFAGAGIFEECKPVQSGTYIAGKGVYLLTIMPAEGREGRAPATGLGNGTSPCNTDTILEAVKFRHIHLNSFLNDGELDNQNLLRNRVAYRCFGVKEVNAYLTSPFSPPMQRYKLMDELREENELSNCDVPLAIFYWTDSGGVEFVDMWAVRRRLTKRSTRDDWSPLAGDRRVSEGDAMLFQFQDQIETLLRSDPELQSRTAAHYFRHLPPAGLLPLRQASFLGVSVNEFFKGQAHREPEFIDGMLVRDLLIRATEHEPIDLANGEMVWLYKVWQSIKANTEGRPVHPYIVFTSAHLPNLALARFDVARWDYSNYARCENCEV
jgi:hypothetical protein